MIAFLEGCVAARSATGAVLNVGGVGYEMLMSSTSLAMLPPEGEQAHVITYLSASDSGVVLYGFMEPEEEALFRALIAVSGIGPKMALGALSALTPEALSTAVLAEDVKTLSKIPGIGKKTASRMVLELKGTLPAFSQEEEAASSGQAGAMKVAMDALLSMGFTKVEIADALKGSPADATEEALLQYALKRIGS